MRRHDRTVPGGARSTRWMAALFVGTSVALGLTSSYVAGVTRRNPWIDDNPKPRIWPPVWVFPLAWVVNYTCMGLAVWHVWRRRGDTPVGPALGFFAADALHNLAFMPIVYAAKKRSVYVAMDTLGTALTVNATVAFARVSRSAALLMLPVLSWMVFTTAIKVKWWRMEDA